MDKKNRAAFEGFCKRLEKAAIAGENPAEYLAPEVKVCAFALEKGFALSGTTKMQMGSIEEETKDVGRYEVGETYDGNWTNTNVNF